MSEIIVALVMIALGLVVLWMLFQRWFWEWAIIIHFFGCVLGVIGSAVNFQIGLGLLNIAGIFVLGALYHFVAEG